MKSLLATFPAAKGVMVFITNVPPLWTVIATIVFCLFIGILLGIKQGRREYEAATF